METDYLISEYVNVKAGAPFRLFPFGQLVKNGKAKMITPELAAKFKLPHFKPPIKLGSHADTTPAGGHIAALEVREDGLWAIPEYTDKGRQATDDGDYRYQSPEVLWEGAYENPENGEPINGPLIVGAALLHTPHLGEQAALYEVTQINQEDINMNDTVQVPASLWDKFEAWVTAKFDKEPEAPPEPQVPEVDPDQFAAAVKERDEYKAKIDALEAEKAKTETVGKLASELQNKDAFGASFIELEKANEAAEILASMEDSQRQWVLRHFKAMAAQIDESALTTQLGSDGEGDLDEDAVSKFNAAATKIMTERKISYADAVKTAATEQPELYQAYKEGI